MIDVKKVTYEKSGNSILHPGQGADIYYEDKCVGYFGKIHPSISSQLDIEGCFVFEMEASVALKRHKKSFKDISKFPSVRRDISILVERSIEVAEIMEIAIKTMGELLVDSVIFDVYQGEGIADSQKSVGLGLTLESQKATLNEQEINDLALAVIGALQDKLGATLR